MLLPFLCSHLQASKLKEAMSSLREKMPMLEGRAAAEKETTSLREQLQEEKMQRMLKEQAASSLQERVQDLDERQVGMERLVREKEAARAESEALAREYKLKAQKSKDKVHMCSVTSIKDTFRPLWRYLEFQSCGEWAHNL